VPNNLNINVHHVTRVEGHGNIAVRATDGKVEQCEWQVPEAPRFFEAMARGRRWDEIQTLVSRICGICSITHSFASIKAVEDAFGVQISPEVLKYRILAHFSEQLQSHTLHIGYLVAPDLFGVKSVVPLVESHLDTVKKIIAAHRVANNWSDLLAGRTTHPITFKVGGFHRYPTHQELQNLRWDIEAALPLLSDVAETVLSVANRLPAFERDTEYVALVEKGNYTFFNGVIGSTDTKETVPVQKWESVANEYVSPQSTAKWAKWHRDAYACGALARFNLNQQHLSPLGKKWAKMFGMEGLIKNPYLNTVAQLVECAHVVETSLEIIDELLTSKKKPENAEVKVKAGNGAGCVEAPRGILFHRYQFDEKGICTGANMCIPTNQNHGNLQKDMEAFVPSVIAKSTEDDIRLHLEMLVRSYDPCISCSTHFLDVNFV
jgi:sulfhydrogenase subunit alpha